MPRHRWVNSFGMVLKYVRHTVLMAVSVKIAVFWILLSQSSLWNV